MKNIRNYKKINFKYYAASWILLATGCAFILMLVFWVLGTGFGILGRPAAPRLFGANLQHAAGFTFSQAASQQLAGAQARMDKSNQVYNTLCLLSDIAIWTSFLATSAIALVTGTFNLSMPKPDVQVGTDNVTGVGELRLSRFHTLGFLAAVASICTLLGTQLGAKASTTLACSKEIRDQITQVAQALKDSPGNEFALLNRLRDATARRCS